MRTAGKVLAWFVGIIIVLYIILALVLHYAVKPSAYKSFVENAVLKTTGHKMVINGQLSWKIFPNPSIKITDVLIENQNGTEHVSPYFAKVQEADIRISLVPLLSGQVVPKTLILRNANINLVYQSAKNNPIAKAQKVAVEKATTEPAITKSIPATAITKRHRMDLTNDHQSNLTYLQHMKLPNVTVINTNINWIDLKNNSITNFKNINITIHPSANQAFIKGGLEIVHKQQTAKLKLSTELVRDNDNTKFAFQDLAFSGDTSSKDSNNSLDYRGPLTIDLTKQTLAVPNYRLTWNKLPMTGEINASWKITDSGLDAMFNASTHVANGLINEKGQYHAPDKSADSFNYLLSIHHIDLAPLLKSVHYDKLLKGTGNLTATLSSNNNHNWISNLNGNGNFKLTDTELGKLNTSNYFNQAFSKLHKQKVQNNGVTVFSNISGSFKIHNGVFYNNDLKANAKKMTTTGSGNINFNDKMINYHLYLQHNSNKDFTLPLVIKGDLQHPKVSLDLKGLIKNSVKHRLFKNLFHDKKFDLKKIF
jgi:uncharacterized protein involved in outer membrane biogenesis